MNAVVSGLALTAVKATRLLAVDRIALELEGVRENRRFFLIDERGRMVNAKQIGVLQTIVAGYSDAERTLSLTFPGGRVISDRVRLGPSVDAKFYSSPVRVPLVLGPWSEAVSELVSKPLRLVESDRACGAVDRAEDGTVSLISSASLRRLARAGGARALDSRRFRMLVEIDGVEPHGEDQWVGRSVRIGSALVAFTGHVGRCVITSSDPETGVVDVPTLELLGSSRRGLGTTEPLPFGIHGEVLRAGSASIGDPVVLDGR